MLNPSDVQRLTSSRAVCDFFGQSLGYRVNSVPFDAGDLGIPPAPARLVREVELLCDYYRQFQVYRMEVNSLRRTDLRAILEPFYRKHPAGNYLFVFTKDYREHAFVSPVRVLADDDDDATKTKLRLRTLRVDCANVYRTDVETLENIRLAPVEQSPQAIWEKHRAAFDVERVNKEFFDQYERCFKDEAKPAVKKALDSDDNDVHFFTQMLLNRLMFCWFLQKKGWLGGRQDYLLHLLDRAERRRSGEDGRTTVGNLYHDYLTFLFFEVLCNPEEQRRKHYPTDPEVSREAPFLNGGLFERAPLDERMANAPRLRRLPNSVFQSILKDLFARYNFTVEESTTLDVQVALDPELLGTIFERLVTGRHETGSYYTPRPVVEFMCREALAHHVTQSVRLRSNATQTDSLRYIVEDLVFNRSVERLSLDDANDLVRVLDSLKVCDPACGSGAYLVTLLHELVDIYRAIYNERLNDPQKDYDLKLRIIERNLYGVDKDEFAVNIARLRLWLTLIVDNEETDWRKVKPLPNLDFKIEVGDSLTAPNPQIVGQQAFRHELVRNYRDVKARYMRAYGDEKLALRTEAHTLRQTIAQWTHSGKVVQGFDWAVEFAEVFDEGGFDVVLANPPYVRADPQFKHVEDEEARQEAIQQWKVYRATLLKSGIYQTLYEKWDLYLPFLERAYQLLRPNGRMVFIISDAYNAAKYARKSHEFFLEKARVERIDFCTEIPLFEAGVNNTIVHFAKAAPDANHQPVRVRRWGETRDDFERNAGVLPTAPQAEFGAALFKPDGAKPTSAAAGFVPLERICYISYGLRANADDRYWQGEFTTEDCLSPTRDATHPKPFVQGKDFVKWWVWRVWYLEWGTARAPKKFSRPTFPALHEAKEKLIAVRTPGATPKVIYDDDRLHFDASSVGFVPWHHLKGVVNNSISKTAKYRRQDPKGDREERERISQQFHLKYVLAVMNSTFAKEWLAKRRRSKIHVYPDDWKQLPIAPIPMEQQTEFVKLVDAILTEFEQHGYPLPPDAAKRVAELAQEIDERVAGLYGL